MAIFVFFLHDFVNVLENHVAKIAGMCGSKHLDQSEKLGFKNHGEGAVDGLGMVGGVKSKVSYRWYHPSRI